MLIDRIIKYSNKQFLIYGDRCGNTFCNHPSGKCSGSCYNCLYQIHFPGRFDGQSPKEKYDCPKMLYHYVCQYSYLYTSELLCALEEESQYIDDFPYYHILSLGCGGCADLMAFDLYRDRHQNLKAVSYVGIDVNQLWQPIHEEIYDYCRDAGIQFQAKYDDVFKLLSDGEIRDANIVVKPCLGRGNSHRTATPSGDITPKYGDFCGFAKMSPVSRVCRKRLSAGLKHENPLENRAFSVSQTVGQRKQKG